MKIIKNRKKNNENSRISQIFQICSILGVFHGNLRQLGGVFGLSRGVLEASWGVLEPSWRLLGDLEASWRCLGGILGRCLGYSPPEARTRGVTRVSEIGPCNCASVFLRFYLFRFVFNTFLRGFVCFCRL